jgi:purine-cytosine permease-like protein
MVLGALLVPVGGVLVAHYYIRRPQVSEAFIAELYDPAGSFRGVSIAGVTAWAAGAAAFFAAGSIGGTLPALAVSMLVYRALLYTRRR